jgi:beta-glucosidase
MTAPPFPALGFGVATSSFQIEGGSDADGRGPSIWDTFCATPGAISDGTDGREACDSYHRLDDDLTLLAELGVSAYRFSVAWPRVQPTGSGAVESRGLDYYERLVDGLLSRGIRPVPTLYHWDLPQPLEDAGGWPVRSTAERFADYALVVAGRLRDRVTCWATMNEPWCSAFLGYAAGVHAPGRRDPEAAFAAAHHLLLGHALGREAIRSTCSDAQVGIVLNLMPVHAESDADPAAVDHVDAVQNRLWLDPLADGHYPPRLTAASAALRDGDDGVMAADLATIRGSLDWLGVNYYTPIRVGAPRTDVRAVGQESAAYPYAPPLSFRPRPPRTDMGWEINPGELRELLGAVSRRLPGLPLKVTENGAAFPDATHTADGAVDDGDRISYLRDHITAVEQARADGAQVDDYFAWSLLDNFEWAEGYRKTFGLVTVEAGTLRRVPKRSFHWYGERIAAPST